MECNNSHSETKKEAKKTCCSSSGGGESKTACCNSVGSSASPFTLPSQQHEQHKHSYHHDHHDDDTPQQEHQKVLCLAVVRENGADVVMFDSQGIPRSFSYTPSTENNTNKLCFSSHGHGQHVDEFLTPCFDEDGKHGVPEEGCFCGVDTPHLHAHLHNPKTCAHQDDGMMMHKKTKKISEADDFMYLAGLTLYPTEEGDEKDGSGDLTPEEAGRLLHWGVTEQLPNQCNSKEIVRHMEQNGCRQRNSNNNSSSKRRMSMVQHHDHVDYLVHDTSTGDLHLEHPCDDCGDNDVHGRFNCVGKRRLSGVVSGGELHFFEVPASRFNILEHLSTLFDPSSADRVLAARTTTVDEHHHHGQKDDTSKSCCQGGVCTAAPMAEEYDEEEALLSENENIVRSTFLLSHFCCASEIPIILEVLEPMSGVDKILTNAPVRMVTVHHDPSVVTAQDIEAALNKEHFGATVKVDGGAQRAMQKTTGRSQFHVQKICCASEIPAIRSIVCPMEGVSKVSINITTKIVYVEHDTNQVTATQIRDVLNADRFGATIKHDAANDVAPLSTFVRSTLSFETTSTPDTSTLKEFLAATFDATRLESFVVDVPEKKINVVHNPFLLPVQTIVDMLAEQLALKVTIEVDGATSWSIPRVEVSDDDEVDDKVPNPTLPTILSGVFWVISMFSFIGGNWVYLKYVALLSVAFGLPSIGLKAFKTLSRFQFDTNVLMFIAAVGALGLQEFTEAGAVTFLFSISEWLEVRATSRARSALSEIVRLRPEKANLIHPVSKEVIVVPASAVPVGSLVSVKTGDKIPCDGLVVEGNTTVDESSLTGESRPVRKGPDDKVSGGTINSGNTQLVVRTTATAENSAVSRLIRLVEEAQANRSPTEKMVDEFAKRYTPLVIFAALCMCSIPWAFGKHTGRDWVYNGLVLIVVACPCALIISTPVTYVAGIAACAQRGIVVKGGSHLEALGMVKKIAFDKTGTLTQGSFDLLHLEIISDDYTREEVLQYLTVIEERASHPLAQAIVAAAQNEKVSVPKGMTAKNHTQLAGEGVTANVNCVQVHVGNERLMCRLGLFDTLSEDHKNMVQSWASLGGTVAFLSIEDAGIVCAFCVADAIRPEAASVMDSLHRLRIETIMLTGDNRNAALAIGKLVGLGPEEIRSELLPEDKLTIVSEMKQDVPHSSICANPFRPHGLVLMCGDGVNDGPALAISNVGVAMGAGAALAMETADVTLLDSQLDKLVYSIRMGKKVIRKIFENMTFSIVVKAVVAGFAFAGYAQLWAAIACDVGAMLIVTLNGMTLLSRRKKSVELLEAKAMGV